MRHSQENSSPLHGQSHDPLQSGSVAPVIVTRTVAGGLAQSGHAGKGLGLGDGLGLGLGDGDGLGLGEGLGDGEGLGLGDGDGEGLGLGLGDGQSSRVRWNRDILPSTRLPRA